MRLADTAYDNSKTGCCAPVNRQVWDNKEWHWKDKPFLHDHVHALLHIPLDFGKVMGRDQALVEAAEAWPQQPFWLSDDVSPWGSELYTAVEKDISGQTMSRLSGTFLSRVFEGPYSSVGQFHKEVEDQARQQGKKVEKLYTFYATCPKCLSALGKNEMVVFAKVG
jgi:hypothetical protein